MAVYQNITGVVKICKPEGYGFIVPDTLVGAHDRDIFFHKASLESIDWSKVQVGQKVKVASVISNHRGLQASNVSFV